MKKMFMALAVMGFLLGCENPNVVSVDEVRTALDIARTETANLYKESPRYRDITEIFFLNAYLNSAAFYDDNIDCSYTLDLSDVEGKKFVRACILKGVYELTENKDILVIATREPFNKIVLTFSQEAKKTDEGFSHSQHNVASVTVNLGTKKIGFFGWRA